MTELYQLLGIRPGITAIIGSGGKTSLLSRLCRELPGTVIVCTSAHIFPAENLPLVTGSIDCLPAPKICLGTPAEGGKLTAPIQEYEALSRLADYVLVEADGSRGLPLKAHQAHEPVIPPCSNRVIGVLGLSGLGQPIEKAAHRPEQYARLCSAAVTDLVTAERAATVLNRENLADCYVLNQADDLKAEERGRMLGALLNKPFYLTCLKGENGSAHG